MSQEQKPEKPGKSQELEKLPKGTMSIPRGELDDMKREFKRVARKRREEKPQTPNK